MVAPGPVNEDQPPTDNQEEEAVVEEVNGNGDSRRFGKNQTQPGTTRTRVGLADGDVGDDVVWSDVALL